MNNRLFDIATWNKKIDEKSHEERFKDWLNSFSSIKFEDNKIDQDNSSISFSNSFRVSKLPGSIKVETDYFKGKDGAGSLFASLLANWDDESIEDEDLGAKYLGTSLVFFPCYKLKEKTRYKKDYKYESLPSGIIIAMGMGSGGPGPDEMLVTNPGHIRRFEGLVKTITSNIEENTSILWFREDPLLHKPVPERYIEKTRQLFNATPTALRWRDETSGGYGQYLYAITSLKFDIDGNLTDNQKHIISGFIKFYSRERGLKKGKELDPAKEWYNAIFSNIEIKTIQEKTKKNKYLILSGPPGVKKTDYINQIAEKYQNSKQIQFHPNTTYHSFVGGIQPVLKESKTNFEFYKGPLIQAIEEAKKLQEDSYYLLVIDEINRADLASVLGEAINLFEPTKKYEIDIPNYGKIEMPKNLHILCAMNTADRNISSIDVAIRRRFAYIQLWPDEPSGENSSVPGRVYFNKIKDIFLEYGNRSDLYLMPGGFYFLGNNEDLVKESLSDRLLPLLEDYLNENRLSGLLLNEIDLFIQEFKQKF